MYCELNAPVIRSLKCCKGSDEDPLPTHSRERSSRRKSRKLDNSGLDEQNNSDIDKNNLVISDHTVKLNADLWKCLLSLNFV